MIYSFDAEGLIEDLENDIQENGVSTVWAYSIKMPNGQELFVDYFYVAGEHPFRRFGPTLKEFEASLSKEYSQFARTKMPAAELLEIFKKEDETL